MKFRFEQKVIYRDLDPFVIISLWVFAVSLQFSYAIKWDHNICHGGRRGRRRRLQRRGKLKKCGALKEKYIHNSFYLSTGATKHFNECRTLAFYGISRLKLGSFICFRASIFNIHKYLLNRPEWFHIERWYQNKQAESERHFQPWKTR